METYVASLELRTLLLTDLVNSTALVDQVGDRRAAEIGAGFDRVSRDLLARHGGVEIDKTDGFLLLFDRPLDAVAYAQDMHAALRTLSEEQGRTLRARCGVHLGEVTLRRNPPEDVVRGAKPLEVEGLAKPLAARVMSLAEGGQTLLTRTAFDVAKRAATGESRFDGLTWCVHGHYLLKGVSEPVEICEVGLVGLSPLAAPASADKARRIGDGDRSRLALRVVATLVVLSALAGGALWAADPWGERVAYYHGLHHRFGAPEGMVPLATVPPALGLAYEEVRTLAGRVVQIRSHNGSGEPDADMDKPVVQHLEWEDDRVVRIRHTTPQGLLVFEESLEHLPQTHQVLSTYTRAGGVPSATPWTTSDHSAMLTTYDADTGLKTASLEVSRVTHEPWGLPATTFTWDAQGWLTRTDRRDADGNPVVGGDGWVTHTITRDAHGLPTREAFLGFGGAPVNSRSLGCSSTVTTRDGQDRVVHRTCEGPDGDPAPFLDVGCFQQTFTYAPDRMEEHCLDATGSPMISKQGAEIQVRHIGPHGYLSQMAFLDASGQPSHNADGAAVSTMAIDAWGRRTRMGPMLDTEGAPVWTKAHGWGETASFDDAGRLSAVAFLDPAGKPGLGPEGHAVLRFERDSFGRVTAVRFYDDKQQPTMSKLSRDRAPAEIAGNLRSLENEPRWNRYHARVFEYAEGQRRPNKERFLDGANEPMTVDGVAAYTFAYDDLGARRARSAFGVDGEPVLARTQAWRSGAFMWCHRDDEVRDLRARVLTRTCIGTDGAPRMTARGFATIRYQHGDLNVVSEVRFEDEHGNPVSGVLGYARHVHETDAHGNITSHQSFDDHGAPVDDADTSCARSVSTWDPYGRNTSTCCFGPTGEPAYRSIDGVHCSHVTRDTQGRILLWSRVDVDGRPMLGTDGYAQAQIVYSEPGTDTHEVRYLGLQGQPVKLAGGYAAFYDRYDHLGRLLLRTFLGIDGELAPPSDLHATCPYNQQTYDVRGNLVEIRRQDNHGDPCTADPINTPVTKLQYDRRGRPVRVDNFDGHGNKMLLHGAATSLSVFDDQGNITRSTHLDADGRPVTKEGCAEARGTYDRDGRLLSKSCFDPDGEPTADHEGAPVWRYTYGLGAEPIGRAAAASQQVVYEPALSSFSG